MNKADLFYKPLLKEAWGITKKYYWIIVGLLVVYIFASIFSGVLPELIKALFIVLIGFILRFYYTRLSISMARNKDIKFKDIFIGFDNFKKFISVYLVYSLIILAVPLAILLLSNIFFPMHFLVLLGGILKPEVIFTLAVMVLSVIIVSSNLMFAPYFAIDKGINIKESFRESLRITKGNRFKIFILILLMILATIVSMLPFLLGLLLTVPLVLVIPGLLYVRLSGNTENVIITDDIVAQPLEITNETDAEVVEPMVITQQ